MTKQEAKKIKCRYFQYNKTPECIKPEDQICPDRFCKLSKLEWYD